MRPSVHSQEVDISGGQPVAGRALKGGCIGYAKLFCASRSSSLSRKIYSINALFEKLLMKASLGRLLGLNSPQGPEDFLGGIF